jgi:hypothetical protein
VTKNRNTSECGTSISQYLSRKVKDVIATDGGTIDITWSTSQVIDSVAKCQQFNSQIADVTSQLMNAFGVKVVEEQEQKATSESQAQSKSTAKTEGLGDIIKSLLAAIMGPYALSSLAICCCIIIAIVIAYYSMSSGDKKITADAFRAYNNKKATASEEEEQNGGYNGGSYKGYFIKKFLDGIKENRKIHKWN